MSVSTINIPFQDDFLVQIDQIANTESKTRSEFIFNAVKLYIDRVREFDVIFKTGRKIGSTLEISEADVMKEIKNNRSEKAS